MSSFMISAETLGRAVYPIARGEKYFPVAAAQALGTTPDDPSLTEHLTLAMRELNECAVCERYKGALPSVAVAIRPRCCTLVQSYKSLKCWLYHCSEGDIPETSALYQGMRKLASLYAKEIVEASKDYEKADWD